MLQVMLMRQADDGLSSIPKQDPHDGSSDLGDNMIFDKTKAWLKEDTENHIFHLVIDELHLNRGSGGTESAYLIRLLLDRLGLKPGHHQLRILASSASLESDDPQSRKFLSDFFGIDNVEIIKGTLEPPSAVCNKETLPHSGFAQLGMSLQSSKTHSLNVSDASCVDALGKIAEELGVRDVSVENIVSALQRSGQDAGFDLRGRFERSFKKSGNDAQKLLDLGKSEFIFGGDIENEECHHALIGLLTVMSFDGIKKELKDELSRFRIHQFIRNPEGVWVGPRPASADDVNRFFGDIFFEPSGCVDPDSNSRLQELLYCVTCGTTLFAGQRQAGITVNPGPIPGDRVDHWEMCSIEQKLENAPQKKNAELTESKSHAELLVFWPETSPHTENLAEHRWSQEGVPDRFAPDGECECQWKRAQLHPESGRVDFFDSNIEPRDGWIDGYLFSVVNSEDGRHALQREDVYLEVASNMNGMPSECPCCGDNHNNRQNRKTPIRNFRPGVGVTTQVLTRSVRRGLLAADYSGQEKLKTVAFSDSRDQAATLSAEIDLRQFEDNVREILLNHMVSYLAHVDILKSSADAMKAVPATERFNVYTNLIAEYPDHRAEIKDLRDAIDDLEENQHQPEHQDYIDADNKIKIKLDRQISLANRLSHENLDVQDPSNFVKECLKLGMHPLGPGKYLKYEFGEAERWWTHLFEQRGDDWVWKLQTTVTDSSLRTIRETRNTQLKRLLNRLMFSRTYYGFESMGIARYVLPPEVDSKLDEWNGRLENIELDQLRGLVESFAILLGEQFRYNPNDSLEKFGRDLLPWDAAHIAGNPDAANLGDKKKKARKFVWNLAERFNPDADDATLSAWRENLSLAIYEIMNAATGNAELILEFETYKFKFAREDDHVFRCQNCFRPTLSEFAGACTTCQHTEFLRMNDETAGDLKQRHYYSPRGERVSRLSCEELTGQSDDQPLRQRQFRNNLIEGREFINRRFQHKVIPHFDEIDLLSVTTTMEVGVDIGSLNSIIMANMPPERFNYQQRVGRAGRKGQRFAYAFTFCRSNSHDAFYFENAVPMTSDKPPVPFISMDRQEIAERVLRKEILRRAFMDEDAGTECKWHEAKKGSTHGEFPCIDNFMEVSSTSKESTLDLFIQWCKDNESKFKEVALQLSPHDEVFATELAKNLYSEMIDKKWWGKNLADADGEEGLSDYLAENGWLPLLGLPSRVKKLYQRLSPPVGRDTEAVEESIDRDQDVAIVSFAPGARRMKDKRIFKPNGFSPEMSWRYPLGGGVQRWCASGNALNGNQRFVFCDQCHSVKLLDQGDFWNACTTCGNPKENPNTRQAPQDINGWIPAAFRVENEESAYVGENFEQGINSSSYICTEMEDDEAEEEQELNSIIEFNGKNGRVFTINDNRGEGFNLGLRSTTPIADGKNSPHLFGQREINDVDPDINISLYSPKITDIFRLRHKEIPIGIDLNLRGQSKGSAVRIAFYSAGELIRRAWANQLDISEKEIDVLAPLSVQVMDDPPLMQGLLVFADTHANGAGYCNQLKNEWKTFLNSFFDGTNNYANQIIGREEQHAFGGKNRCKKSCYLCLKSYGNRFIDPLLDWRLGLDVLKLFADSEYKMGLLGNFKVEDGGLASIHHWREEAELAAERFCHAFTLENVIYQIEEGFSLPVIQRVIDGESQYIIVKHPLWENNSSIVGNILDKTYFEISQRQPNLKTLFVDSFNLEHRPTWVRWNLIEKKNRLSNR